MTPSEPQEDPPDTPGNDDQERGLELVRRGIGYGKTHQLEKGVLCLLEGLFLIDQRREPRLYLSASHNLALYFAHLGLPTLARGILARVEKLYTVLGDPLLKGRLLWLEGTISRYSSDFRRAEERMLQALEHFRQHEHLQDQVGLVEEELADVVEERKRLEARRKSYLEEFGEGSEG